MRNACQRILSTFLVSATLGALSAVDVGAQTFTACRVPDVGAIYMIGVPGTPSDCLDPTHVEFSWMEGGQVADSAITSNKIAAGAVTSGKIADGAVTSEKIEDGTIVGSDIADYQITTQHILPEGIDGTAIAAGSIQSSDIQNGSIGPWDLMDGTLSAEGLGVEVVEVDRSVANTGVDLAYATCPTGKRVIAGGYTITRVDGAPSNELATISDRPIGGTSWYVVIRSPTTMTLFEWTAFAVCIIDGS